MQNDARTHQFEFREEDPAIALEESEVERSLFQDMEMRRRHPKQYAQLGETMVDVLPNMHRGIDLEHCVPV